MCENDFLKLNFVCKLNYHSWIAPTFATHMPWNMIAYNEVRQEVYYYLFIVEDAPKKKRDIKIQDLELSQNM